jgi:hypothetical protein
MPKQKTGRGMGCPYSGMLREHTRTILEKDLDPPSLDCSSGLRLLQCIILPQSIFTNIISFHLLTA